jgi:NNP family nitrate/nitrite transporter-like MFS transporter
MSTIFAAPQKEALREGGESISKTATRRFQRRERQASNSNISVATKPPDLVLGPSRGGFFALSASERGPPMTVAVAAPMAETPSGKTFWQSGHRPTLLAAFLYFDVSFMVWVMLGPLAPIISTELELDPAQKGLMVAVPTLAGAVLRIVNGLLGDRIGQKMTGTLNQIVVIAGLLVGWWYGVDSFAGTLALGVILGFAGASFAVALPLASRWYPPEHQGKAMGIAGMGNSGTVLAALFAPILAKWFGWNAVLGLAVIPLVAIFVVYQAIAKDSPSQPAPKPLSAYGDVLKHQDAWWFMLFYSVSFGGFVGLSNSLSIWYTDNFALTPVVAGYYTAACVFMGSLVRPFGGALADRFGGTRTLMVVYTMAAMLLAAISTGPTSLPIAVALFMLVMATLGVILGFAGASFAVALPLASRWYPPEHQGKAMGIAGMGNSGTVLAALFAPILAKLFGWNAVLGLAVIPLAVIFVVYQVIAKDSPNQPAPKPLSAYGEVLKEQDAWWFMLFYSVSFGGFVGLSNSLSIWYTDNFALTPVVAGYYTAACVFMGSLVRPFGGALADRFGGTRTLTFVYTGAAMLLAAISTGPTSLPVAVALFMLVMATLGIGNGAVFQLVPQRFGSEIGVMTGLVGFAGGVGGFYLASSLGFAQKYTGSASAGFLIFAGLAVVALASLTMVKGRWRSTWGELAAARI